MHPLAYFCKLILMSLVQSVSAKAIESCVYVNDKNKVWKRPKDKMELGKDTALFDQVSPHDSSFMGADPNPPSPHPQLRINLEKPRENWILDA